jgi:hypothetical protein
MRILTSPQITIKSKDVITSKFILCNKSHSMTHISKFKHFGKCDIYCDIVDDNK